MANFEKYSTWSVIEKGSGFYIRNSNPIDSRIVVQTYDEIKGNEERNIECKIIKARRYPGLRIYVMDQEKEYWFKSGVENENLVEYNPWDSAIFTALDANPWAPDITSSINQLKADKPWLSDMSSGGGSESGSFATTYIVSSTEYAKNDIPTYLTTQITSPSTGQEVNVVFREDDVESFMKFIYINNGWAILDGTQTISFSLPAYGTVEWDSLPATSDDSIRYVTGENGSITVYVKHGFCTQCVDTTLYQTDTEVDPNDTDDATDAYGEELLVSKKCVALSGRSGYWVKLEMQAPTTSSDSSTNYTLLLQR